MNFKKLQIASAAAVLVIAALGALIYFSVQGQAGGLVEYRENITGESTGRNAIVFAALMGAGLNDSFVDISPSRAYVAYNLPEGYFPQSVQQYAIGAAATEAYTGSIITVVQYVAGVPAMAWSVSASDFNLFGQGLIGQQEFESRISKQAL
jgi:hypothetical protein